MTHTRVASLLVLAFALVASVSPGASSRADAGLQPAAAAGPVVAMKTSMGEIRIRLNPEKAPLSVANFLAYVNKQFYDGTIFHRVIPTFMIQGGGFGPDLMRKQTQPAIKLEAQNGLKNVRGSVAMARTGDPDSATAQFFINVVDNAALDYKAGNPGYAVFGEVIAGMDVVDKIKAVSTTEKGGMRDVPVQPVVIETVRVVSK